MINPVKALVFVAVICAACAAACFREGWVICAAAWIVGAIVALIEYAVLIARYD